ncbi:SDR family NAD(P)-dependent oxidoreductase [Streptomyces sp. NPDC058228]|uniref:SDR family NAD(P)-dependent oxidoreductase n=1 Tax=Streptomyces sp. NPDC058228 TaxID=3346390 RepID=UPI0036EC27D0
MSDTRIQSPAVRTWGDGAGLAGKGLIVTGASSGIGRAMALEAASAGLDLILVDRAADGLERTHQEVDALGAKAQICPVDLTEFSAYQQIIEVASSAADGAGATLLFHAAGIVIRREWTSDVTEHDWDQQVAVNQKASWFLTRAFSESLRSRSQSGSAVLVSSISASLGVMTGSWVYASTKGGVSSMVRGFAKSYGPHGIRVNGMAPGLVETPMVRGGVENSEVSDFIESNVPLGRTAQPTEIARAGMFLLSDYASYVAGVILDVDGGWLRR